MDTGESAQKVVTPSRREGRVAPVEPVVTNSCAFLIAHEAAGAASTRLSLRPPHSEGLAHAAPGRVSAAGMRTHAACVHANSTAERLIQIDAWFRDVEGGEQNSPSRQICAAIGAVLVSIFSDWVSREKICP
jgi:hypothetical protein